MAKRVVRTVLAVVAGIVFISAVVEGLEFALVTLINSEPTTNPDVYYGIRNRGWFLATKLVYNSLAAIGGGFLAAAVAGYAQLKHGLAVAVAQTLAFLWGLTQPAVSRRTPGWMWACLIVLTFAGIVLGARMRATHRSVSVSHT